MNLNIAANDASQRSDKIVNLTWVGATDCIGHTDAVDANLVDRLVDGKQVDEVGTEAVFRREADFDALGLDEVDDLNGSLGNVGHVLSMREFAQEGRGSNHDVDTVNAYVPLLVSQSTDLRERSKAYLFQQRYEHRPYDTGCGSRSWPSDQACKSLRSLLETAPKRPVR